MKYLIAAFICFTQLVPAQTEITDIDAESKLLVNNDKLIVVDFYATWCGPCKIMDPILKELSKEYAGRVDFYKIDVDENAVDDALGVTAMPTYYFIKNSASLDVVKGAMSKGDMTSLIEKYVDYTSEDIVAVEEVPEEAGYDSFNINENHGTVTEFSDKVVDEIWNDYSKLNSLAWHAYEYHDKINDLLKAIEIVERSIELYKINANVDTHAALLFKTGNYTQALKKAKEAIEVAKQNGESYEETSQLMNKIIDKM
ncbi:thiol reductase thioredoxin [Nonlabens sp. Ci31]|jgi:thioredoxin 1|uniref:thioredoxin family protein n=1 Tax=Nonlabens sp. Ci31 TaxID=2608253 RepID=UPI001464878C|nr:thioredoxin domain-containing protein [Nonlabens sp. Ci31]QJP35571.1 thiol reductase thioredoxin [Nonlabens sp. Ci31]